MDDLDKTMFRIWHLRKIQEQTEKKLNYLEALSKEQFLDEEIRDEINEVRQKKILLDHKLQQVEEEHTKTKTKVYVS